MRSIGAEAEGALEIKLSDPLSVHMAILISTQEKEFSQVRIESLGADYNPNVLASGPKLFY